MKINLSQNGYGKILPVNIPEPVVKSTRTLHPIT